MFYFGHYSFVITTLFIIIEVLQECSSLIKPDFLFINGDILITELKNLIFIKNSITVDKDKGDQPQGFGGLFL